MNDRVIVNYKMGALVNTFNRGGVEYAMVETNHGEEVETYLAHDVVPVDFFLAIAKKAELEICQTCNGIGKIDPIENPPYECDVCSGRGYFTINP